MSIKDQLGKMVGPLPMGAWVALVGGGLAFAYYTRTHSTDTSAAGAYDNISTDPGVGLGGTPAGYSDTSDDGSGTTTPSSGYTITDNDSWASAAVNALIARGYTPANANSAISKYLSGGTPTLAEWALINIAMSIPGVGAPPTIPTTVTPPTPTPVTKPPTPKPTPKPPVKKPAPKPPVRKPTKPQAPKAPPKKKTVTYTVKHGDSLSRIAEHYHINWHTLYSANRKKIGSNPNLIHPGLSLTIPH